MNINKPQLTISLLASDRPLKDLRRCLDSLRPIMQSIPCELILIDTSKNPKIHEILLEYSDLVYEFEWCKDFAKARNEGLKRAKGEWFMFLDDDEWFVETDALIDFFCSGEYKQYGFANYQIRNFHDVEYVGYSDCWVSRMFRIEKDTHFASKIHEYFTPIRGERKHIQAMAYHSGYINDTPEKAKARYDRNVSLLLEMEKEEPYNMRWKLHLVQSYYSVAEWETLETYSRECLKTYASTNEKYNNIHIGTFYIGLIHSLIYLERYEESIEICKQALADKRSTSVLKALTHLKLSENYFRLKEWDKAIEEVAEYLCISQTVNHHSADILEQQSALIAGSAFDDGNQKIAYSTLICSQLEKGNIKELIEYYDKLEWDKPVVFTIENIEKYMVKAMWTLPYEDIFARIMIDVFEKGKLRELFRKAIILQEEQVLNAFQAVLYIFATAMQNVIEGPREDDMIGYYDTLQQYVQATCQWYDFLQEQELLGVLGERTPGYLQAAVNISDYIEFEPKDRVQALSKLKEAVECLPEFAEGIGKYLHSYGELEKQRGAIQKNEMETLRTQVINQVKAMIVAGQPQAASQIVAQLKQMFPGDEEIIELDISINN